MAKNTRKGHQKSSVTGRTIKDDGTPSYEFDQEFAMTHFTSQDVAAQILDGWRHEILGQSDDPELGPKELSLRLYSRYGMNDPTEHLHAPRKVGGGNDGQQEDGSGGSRLVFPDTAFVYCGSKATDDETLDRLDLWRAYGANGHGIAITTIWNRKGLDGDGFNILEVQYVKTDDLDELHKEHVKLQMEIKNAIPHSKMSKELHKKRMALEVGYENDDYKSENEIRIVHYAGDKSGSVSPILNFSAESGRLRAFVTRKFKVGEGQTLSGLYVTIGPRVPEYEVSHWKMMVDWTVRQLGLSSARTTHQSKLKYVG